MQSGARNAIRFSKNDKNISEEERKEDIEIYQDQLEALNMAIKALEQQSCDCVSRQALLEFVESKYQSNWWNVDEVLAKIKDLPPVTPTHGTCKDCKHMNTEKRCTLTWQIMYDETYGCADFEKRKLIAAE